MHKMDSTPRGSYQGIKADQLKEFTVFYQNLSQEHLQCTCNDWRKLLPWLWCICFHCNAHCNGWTEETPPTSKSWVWKIPSNIFQRWGSIGNTWVLSSESLHMNARIEYKRGGTGATVWTATSCSFGRIQLYGTELMDSMSVRSQSNVKAIIWISCKKYLLPTSVLTAPRYALIHKAERSWAISPR